MPEGREEGSRYLQTFSFSFFLSSYHLGPRYLLLGSLSLSPVHPIGRDSDEGFIGSWGHSGATTGHHPSVTPLALRRASHQLLTVNVLKKRTVCVKLGDQGVTHGGHFKHRVHTMTDERERRHSAIMLR